jgi:glycosyltransferase involved in cell wall biosynthesis
MRTLFISDTVPYPPNNGKRQRIYHLLKGVARKSDVTLVARTASAQSQSELAKAERLREFCEEVHLLAPADSRRPCDAGTTGSSPRWWHSVSNHLHPFTPALLRASESGIAREFIRSLCAEPFDLIWAETLVSLAVLPADPNTRVVLDLDDIQHRKMMHKLRAASLSLLWPAHALEFLKLRRFERNLRGLPRELVVCSEGDKQLLNAGDRVRVVPNGVDVPDDLQVRLPATAQPTILFVGTMSYPPNQDAARFFVKSIFPIIRAEMPGARFLIVGHEPPSDIQALNSVDGVTVTGSVPKVESYLRDAAIFVAPIRYGGGTRIKILEAMAHRKAIVSTTVGAEGIDVQHGRHLLLADDPFAFAQACLLCLRDIAVRERIAEEGHSLVRQRYTWSRIEREVAHIVSSDAGMSLPHRNLEQRNVFHALK